MKYELSLLGDNFECCTSQMRWRCPRCLHMNTVAEFYECIGENDEVDIWVDCSECEAEYTFKVHGEMVWEPRCHAILEAK